MADQAEVAGLGSLDPSDFLDEPLAEVDELVKRRDQKVMDCRLGLNTLAALAGELTDPFLLAELLAELAQIKKDAGRAYDEVERFLLATDPARSFEVPGLGLVEVKQSVRRTQWQHDELFRDVVARLADEPGLFYDQEDGALMPPSQLAANLVARLRDVLSPSWKVTGVKALGLSPDAYCCEDEAHKSVRLPGRNEAAV